MKAQMMDRYDTIRRVHSCVGWSLFGVSVWSGHWRLGFGRQEHMRIDAFLLQGFTITESIQ